MAKALTYRQLAKIFQKQSDICSKLAKSQMQAANQLPQDNNATDVQLSVALSAYDSCIRQAYSADSMAAQAVDLNAQADAGGEPP